MLTLLAKIIPSLINSRDKREAPALLTLQQFLLHFKADTFFIGSNNNFRAVLIAIYL